MAAHSAVLSEMRSAVHWDSRLVARLVQQMADQKETTSAAKWDRYWAES